MAKLWRHVTLTEVLYSGSLIRARQLLSELGRVKFSTPFIRSYHQLQGYKEDRRMLILYYVSILFYFIFFF